MQGRYVGSVTYPTIMSHGVNIQDAWGLDDVVILHDRVESVDFKDIPMLSWGPRLFYLAVLKRSMLMADLRQV